MTKSLYIDFSLALIIIIDFDILRWERMIELNKGQEKEKEDSKEPVDFGKVSSPPKPSCRRRKQ